MVLSREQVSDVLQKLIDVDWGLTDLDEVQAQVRSNADLRLFGPIASPELQVGAHRFDVTWDQPTGDRWQAASLVTGEHDLNGKVEARVLDCRADGCAIVLDVHQPLPANAFRLSALAFVGQ